MKRLRLSPLRAIRKHCLDCQGGNSRAVAECTAGPQNPLVLEDPETYTPCSLYEYRLGTNPHRRGIGGRGRPEKSKIEAKTPTQVGIHEKRGGT
jgi:hypothetical protein